MQDASPRDIRVPPRSTPLPRVALQDFPGLTGLQDHTSGDMRVRSACLVCERVISPSPSPTHPPTYTHARTHTRTCTRAHTSPTAAAAMCLPHLFRCVRAFVAYRTACRRSTARWIASWRRAACRPTRWPCLSVSGMRRCRATPRDADLRQRRSSQRCCESSRSGARPCLPVTPLEQPLVPVLVLLLLPALVLVLPLVLQLAPEPELEPRRPSCLQPPHPVRG
jgi:hypothetical protein